ncbi:MAG: hypothetical protein EOP54_16615 [Sphingobacteriales bacterium]|nr:MAG: hypothetical protein EOP54_16615 [Sphingobacteriales bacterium]
MRIGCSAYNIPGREICLFFGDTLISDQDVKLIDIGRGVAAQVLNKFKLAGFVKCLFDHRDVGVGCLGQQQYFGFLFFYLYDHRLAVVLQVDFSISPGNVDGVFLRTGLAGFCSKTKAAGKIIIVDRYVLSSYCFTLVDQGGGGLFAFQSCSHEVGKELEAVIKGNRFIGIDAREAQVLWGGAVAQGNAVNGYRPG